MTGFSIKGWLLCALLGAMAAPLAEENPAWSVMPAQRARIHYRSEDADRVGTLAEHVNVGTRRVESFFGHPFQESFDVFVFPHRDMLDAQWQEAWGAPDFRSECWMVASGVARRLDLLSPNAWSEEACEHSAADAHAVQLLIAHELIHVYHGQHNPVPDFTGLDELAWLIEGVATYASGQLDEERVARVRKLLREGKAPTALSGFWSGNEKYGLVGSLARSIDQKSGRAQLFQLLKQTRQEEVLSGLGVTEAQLIEEWKASLSR